MAVLTSTHNLCFERKYENYQSFLSENVQRPEMKFSIYLNRCVFVVKFQITNLSFSGIQLYTARASYITIRGAYVSIERYTWSKHA